MLCTYCDLHISLLRVFDMCHVCHVNTHMCLQAFSHTWLTLFLSAFNVYMVLPSTLMKGRQGNVKPVCKVHSACNCRPICCHFITN
jgi:hypothetical protein